MNKNQQVAIFYIFKHADKTPIKIPPSNSIIVTSKKIHLPTNSSASWKPIRKILHSGVYSCIRVCSLIWQKASKREKYTRLWPDRIHRYERAIHSQLFNTRFE